MDPIDMPDGIIVKAYSVDNGVAVEWPVMSQRQGELSMTVRLFLEEILELPTGAAPPLPERHPHKSERPWPTEAPPRSLHSVELVVTEGLGFAGLREPSAAERERGASVSPAGWAADDARPGPMMVHAFRFGLDRAGDGPERPWAEFRAALLEEAERHRPR